MAVADINSLTKPLQSDLVGERGERDYEKPEEKDHFFKWLGQTDLAQGAKNNLVNFFSQERQLESDTGKKIAGSWANIMKALRIDEEDSSGKLLKELQEMEDKGEQSWKALLAYPALGEKLLQKVTGFMIPESSVEAAEKMASGEKYTKGEALMAAAPALEFIPGTTMIPYGKIAKGVATAADELGTAATYFPRYTPFKNIEPKSVGAASVGDTRINDIYTNPLKRKDRVKLRNQTANNKDLNNLANQINKEKRYSEDTISKFIEIYNSGNPFKIEQLRSMTGNQFKALLRKVGPNGTKKINQETIDLNKNLLDSKIENITDVRLGKLEEQLRKYKGSNPKETGMNLRVNKFGEFDINDIFKLDDDLKYLVNNKNERQRILKRLEKEGILDELGLTNINIQANRPKTISDPQIDQYLKDLDLNYLPKKFDFTSKILNPKQKEIYNNLQNKVTKSMGESDKAVYDIIRENVNRMIKYGVRDKGKSIDEVIDSLQKQTNSNEFLEEVIPLIQKKVKAQKNIEKFREIGIDLDNVNLSHMTAVVDDIDQTFKLNNLFIGLSKKNTAESVIQKKIKNLNKQLDEKGGSVANKNKIKADLEDLQYELNTGNYYESVPETYIEDELFFPEMMRTEASLKKDGGMVGIGHLTRPLGNF
jgi:hypothetical protein